MFEVNNYTSSVHHGWFDDKVLVGYERIQEIKEWLEKIEDGLTPDEGFQLGMMIKNAELAFMVRYEFFKVNDSSMGTGFNTDKFTDFMVENVWGK